MYITTHQAPRDEAAVDQPAPGGKGGRSARVAERRRRRKDEQRTHRQRLAEQTVKALTLALEGIPPGDDFDEWRSHVNRAIYRIRKSARRTPDRDAEAVTAAMHKPLVHTAEDIALEAQLPRKDVEQILSAMMATGAVTRSPRSASPRALGRKVWLYHLSPSGPATMDVLP